MYPLNLTKPGEATAFAVANDAQEHKALSDDGFLPAFESDDGETVESVRAQLDAAGIEYDKRWGLSRLVALIPA